MIDIVLKPEEKIRYCSRLQILLPAVASLAVCQWDVMEDRLEPLGDSLIEKELLLEEIMEIIAPVILILWKNVTIISRDLL